MHRRHLLLPSYNFCVCLLLSYAFTTISTSSSCPPVCTCKWKSGKQSVECNDKALIAIPEGIDSETQLLDMSNNNLQVLPKETFIRAALLDLQKVYLRNCSIGQIDDRALRGLSNVVDLDLSRNLLTSVPSSIFEDVPNLRNLSLAYNPIQKIDSSAFRHVGALTKLDLSHCQITIIASRAFEGIESLELLRLNGNKLSELKLKTVDALSGLHGIELHDNPWYCDCSLRTLKIWLTEKNIAFPMQPVCIGGPSRVHNKPFSQMHANDFACIPEMKIKPDNRYIEGTVGENATIVCRVESIPSANISWFWNERLLLNNSAFSPFQRIMIQESGEMEKRSLLTLTNAQETDSSQFFCKAENQAGIAEANFTLRVYHRLSGFNFFGNGQMTGISAALIILIVAILLVIVCLLYRIRNIPNVREVKHCGDETIPNGTIGSSNDDKTLSIQPSVNMKQTYSPASSHYNGNESQTLPRLGGMSYNNCEIEQQSMNSSRNTYHTQTSNPDLIADTRYQDELSHNGEYQRTNLFYPSSLWTDNEVQKMIASSCDFRVDTNDKTPIIEDVSFYDNFQRMPPSRPLKDFEFPTTSSLHEGTTDPVPSMSTYGAPTDAKIMRVWQKGVHVLPPVNALKRVLNRSSPDEGYQEGCGTDV